MATLKLTFDNIENVPVNNALSLSDWNTFFDLPASGSTFTSVSVDNNVVSLSGGSNITLKSGLFCDSSCATHLTKFEDTGCVVDMECGYTDGGIYGVITPFVHQNSGKTIQNFCTSLTWVSFTTLTKIGYGAFYGCSSLEIVIIPDTVTNIGNNSFVLCKALKSIIIPDSVTNIEASAFFGCLSLTTVTIGCGVTNIGTQSFDETPLKTLYMRPVTAPTVVVDNTFPNNTATLHIPIGANGYDLEPWTNTMKFASIKQDLLLLKLTFDNITNVPVNEASSLSDWNTFFDLPASGSTFTSVFVDGNVVSLSGGYGITLKGGLFCNSSCATHLLKLEDSGCICDMVCEYSLSPMTINTPFIYDDGVTTVMCSALTDVVFMSIKSIGSFAFYNCFGLNSVIIPFGVTNIEISAFSFCVSLSSIILPDSLVSIGDGAFSECGILTGLTIPDKVTNLGASVFSYCTSLKTITIPKGVKNFGDHLFGNCTSLESITIEKGVLSIGQETFYECTSLTSITIPFSVTNIGDNAFAGCLNHSTVNMYPIIAPTTDINTSFGDYGATLHIVSGSSGYDVVPWTNLLKFTTIVQDLVLPQLKLTFNDITSVPVINISDINEWNTFFDLPKYGDLFVSVVIDENTVILSGGEITLKKHLFSDSSCSLILTKIEDVGCVIDMESGIDMGAMTMDSPFVHVSFAPDGVQNVCFYLNDIILSSITTIPMCAFSYQPSLLSVVIPDSVTSIEAIAFGGCQSLPSITIPENVTSIGNGAFNECRSLTTVNMYPMIAPLIEDVNSTFGDNAAILHIQPGATGYGVEPWTNTAKFASIVEDLNVEPLTFPYAVNTGNTISGTTQIGHIAIGVNGTYDFSARPGGVTWYMGPDENLGYLFVHPDYVANRPRFKRTDGFSGYLFEVKICEMVEIMGHEPFSGLSESINYLESVGVHISPALRLTFDNITNVPVVDVFSVNEWNTFFNLPANGTTFGFVVIDNNTVKLFGGKNIKIDDYLFSENEHLVSVDDDGCVKTLGVDCFYKCTKLISVVMRGVTDHLSTSTDYGAFGESPVLKTLKLPNLINGGHCLCYYCVELEEIDFSSVKTLGDYGLYYCYNLDVIRLPKLEDFGYSLFAGNSFDLLEIPNVISETVTNGFFDAFIGIENQNDIYITCDPSLLTHNNGLLHPDLYALAMRNDVYFNGVYYNPVEKKCTGDLSITFDSLDGITTAFDGHLTDKDDIDVWNSIIGYRLWSTPFTGLTWSDNTVTFTGGENILWSLKYVDYNNDWFYSHITKFEDRGCLVSLSEYSILNGVSNHKLETIVLPEVRVVENYLFQEFPMNKPIILPELRIAPSSAFDHAKFSEIYLPKLEYAGFAAFGYLSNINEIFMPLLKHIGGDPLWFFHEISGKTITLTIPPAFMSCNEGQPHTSITDLQSRNSVTISLYPSPLEFTFESQGNGEGVRIMTFESLANTIIEVDGEGRFYNDELGTENPTTTRTIIPGGMRYFYVKVPSGTSKFTIHNPENIIKWGDTGYVNYSTGFVNRIDGFYSVDDKNSPALSGTLDKLLNITRISLYNNASDVLDIDYHFAKMSRNLTQFCLSGKGVGHGDPDTMPRMLKYVYTYCDSDRGGDFYHLPPNIEFFAPQTYYGYTNPTTVGSFLKFPKSLVRIELNGNENVSGDFSDVNDNLCSLNLGGNLHTSGGNIADLPSGMTQITYYGIGNITYTTGRTWSDSINWIVIVPSGPGLSIQVQSGLIIDTSKAAWNQYERSINYFYISGTNTVSMADTTQGGIWGDFTSEFPAPSELAIALKTLYSKVGTISLKGIVIPKSGDGTGFPAGFGDWFRS